MDVTQTRAIGAGVFFVAVFASGFWLSQTGRPLNDIILTIHKLISVAALVFLGMITYRIHQDASLSTGQIAAVAVVYRTRLKLACLPLPKPLPARGEGLNRALTPSFSVYGERGPGG
jgi:hypothetical protein